MDTPLDLELTTRVVYGVGSVTQLGALVAKMGVRNALLVTDPGIVAAGHVERAENSLVAAGVAASPTPKPRLSSPPG